MLSPDAALKIAAGQLNYAGVTRLGFPEAKTVTFTVSKNNSNAWNTAAADKLVIDAYSGSILKKEAFASKTTGQKIAASIRSIHTGEIYGMFSKIIYFICCLIATSLPVTGTFIWINKMKKKNQDLPKYLLPLRKRLRFSSSILIQLISRNGYKKWQPLPLIAYLHC